ncbi:MAG: hypothetical protein V4581_04095 [Bacteroidota bacterium]
MLINTFWKIILKSIGLLLLMYLIDILATTLTSYSSVFGYTDEADGIFSFIALNIILLAAYLSIVSLFLFKSEWLINVLKLEKGFKEPSININIAPQSVLKIIVIVLAGWIFVEALPALIQQLIKFWQMPQLLQDNDRTPIIVYHLLRAVVAFLAMTNSTTIVKWISKQAQ